MKDGEELKTFVSIWFIAIFSTCYCYLIPSQISPGVPRLVSLLPVITVFFILPLPISTVHLAFPTFFFLVWLGNFKLLLFSFNRGPLASTPQLLPMHAFIAIALLPINPKQSNKTISNPFPFSLPKPILLAVKTMILIAIIHAYQHKDNLHWAVSRVLYFIHMYIGFELGFAITAFLACLFLGFNFEIEPQFNEPYLSTSLQEFWGHRWNLMASIILRATTYNPIRAVCTPILGRLWGQMVAIFLTFVVSGVMHELLFFYLMRVPPTWEVTWFFVVHGLFTAAEVAVKKAINGRFQLPKLVSGSLTEAFLFVTGVWLFYVQPIRNGVDVKIVEEASILLNWCK